MADAFALSALAHFPDLHCHTTASDGKIAPGDIAALAKESGVTLLAVTDHDCMDGLPAAAAAARAAGMGFVPGVEISAGDDARVHILGYGVSGGMPSLAAFLKSIREEREQRALEMLDRLKKIGMPLPHEEILRGDGTSVGRPRIAREMIAAGYVRTMQEAFDRYLDTGRPAYVPRKKRPVDEVIALLRAAGAAPVLAHPGHMRLEQMQLLPLLRQWQAAGLMGMEVYHPIHPPESLAAWDALARSLGLLVTGGSDFHETGEGFARLGCTLPNWRAAASDARALLEAIGYR